MIFLVFNTIVPLESEGKIFHKCDRFGETDRLIKIACYKSNIFQFVKSHTGAQ